MSTVLILLSTYNGGKFLRYQLDSLVKQKGVELQILIRDDGSADDTIDIVNKYKSTHSNITLIEGNNCGVPKSFFELAYYAFNHLSKYDYYAFCDQDDVWEPEKLESAVSKLDNYYENKLYFCRAKYVDENLKLIKESPIIKQFDYTTCVYRNPVLGCTMVFDHKLLEYFCMAFPEADRIHSLHDAWLFKCAVYTDAFIVSDDKSYIKYRQHGNNVTNAYKSPLKKYLTAIKRRLGRKSFYRLSAQYFLEVYENYIADDEKRIFIEAMVKYNTSFKSTLRFLNIQKWRTESTIDKFFWRLLVLFRLF